jgi:hypothetical protein
MAWATTISLCHVAPKSDLVVAAAELPELRRKLR